MVVCNWAAAGSCGGISWAAVMVVCDWAAAGSCGGISWAAVMVVCDWAQLVHVEGSVGPAERFDWLCQYRD